LRRYHDDDYDYRYGYWPASTPRKAKGGIKAEGKGGTFGKSWWAKRWIAVLESFNLGARLTRGRSYARSGQVLSVDIEKGLVRAEVQGSRPAPYTVTIGVKALSEAEWQRVAAELTKQALFTAQLLSGEMPQDIEQVFGSAGLSLFPERGADLNTSCSCPDSSNPCKHIAAVYYLLGEEFDRDPFLCFQLRGITRQELLERIAPSGASADAEAEAPAPPESEPLPTDPQAFWHALAVPDDLLGEVRTPPVSAALLRRLGPLPFWRGAMPLFDALEHVYPAAGQRGLDAYLAGASER
jgi:uncharacterized Zn finger protein